MYFEKSSPKPPRRDLEWKDNELKFSNVELKIIRMITSGEASVKWEYDEQKPPKSVKVLGKNGEPIFFTDFDGPALLKDARGFIFINFLKKFK